MRSLTLALFAWTAAAQEPPPQTNPELGKKLFTAHCAPCHGIDATGGRGPNLAVPKLRRAANDQAIFDLVKNGIPGTIMDGTWQLSDPELWRIVSYVSSLGHTTPQSLPGDPSRGKTLYDKLACAGCHIVAGEGRAIGPELSAIGASRSAAYL